MIARAGFARTAAVHTLTAAVLAVSPVLAAPAHAAPASTSPADAAVAAAIRDMAGDSLAGFYRERGWWPLWSQNGRLGPQARALAGLVRSIRADGLDPDDFAPGEIDRAIAASRSGDPHALAAADVLFSAIFADLVADMRTPHLSITYADPALAPGHTELGAILRRAAVAPSLDRYIRTLGWMHPIYTDLRTALLHGGLGDAADDSPRVHLDLSDPALFGGTMAPRGTRSRTALLRLNLERARLLPDAATRHIVVDAASSRLWYYGAGGQAGTMRVVTGTRETPTPMLVGTISYATLRPYWNVPVDLVRKRIAPKVLAGQSLSSLGYEALASWDKDEVIDPRRIDWRAVVAGRAEARVRELPGRANSMGTVKFTFPNEDGIYLHDTNNRALFGEQDRHFSNGCVRLEDAPRLARWLFGGTLKAKTGAAEEAIALPQPLPVYVMYFTALPGADGEVATVDDVYGRDPAASRQVAARSAHAPPR